MYPDAITVNVLSDREKQIMVENSCGGYGPEMLFINVDASIYFILFYYRIIHSVEIKCCNLCLRNQTSMSTLFQHFKPKPKVS